MKVCVFACLSVCSQKKSDKRVLNGAQEYGVYLLK